MFKYNLCYKHFTTVKIFVALLIAICIRVLHIFIKIRYTVTYHTKQQDINNVIEKIIDFS